MQYLEIPLAAGVACNMDCSHFRRGDCPYRWPRDWHSCPRKVAAFRSLAEALAKIDKRDEIIKQLNEAASTLKGLLERFPPEVLKQDEGLREIYRNIEQAYAAADEAAEDLRISEPLASEIEGPSLFAFDE